MPRFIDSVHRVAKRVRRSGVTGIPVAYKIALAFSTVLLAGVVVLFGMVTHYQRELLNLQIDSLGNIIASQFAASVTEPLFTDDNMALQVQLFNLVKDERIKGAAIIDQSGAILVQSGHISALQAPARVPAKTELFFFTDFSLQSVTVSSPVIFDGVTAGHVLVDFIPVAVSRSFEAMLQGLFGLALTMVLLLLVVAFAISRRMAKPIQQLVAATEQIGRGRYDVKLQLNRRDELGTLADALNSMGAGLRQKQKVEGLLNQVVAADVAKTLMARESDTDLVCQRVDASVLFVDIVGFTGLAEEQTPEEVVGFLNDYFGYFTLCGQLFFGSVDKFIGDCAMILFGTPRYNSDHRFNAIACAVVIQRLLQELNKQREAQGLPCVQVRIGINSGDMMAGTVGVAQRMEYTVIGDAVNLASRLTSMAEPGRILVGESTFSAIELEGRVTCEPKGVVAIKGKRQSIQVAEIVAIAPEYLRVMDDLIEDVLARRP